MILDTNAVSGILAGDKDLEKILAADERHQLPVVVIGEYRFGLLNSRRSVKLRPLFDRLTRESIVLDLDAVTAGHYATIRHELKKRGTPIPENDIWIAALARQHELRVVSRDAHFDLVRGLQTVGW
jgi:predicted nucleic acid-binding protein